MRCNHAITLGRVLANELEADPARCTDDQYRSHQRSACTSRTASAANSAPPIAFSTRRAVRLRSEASHPLCKRDKRKQKQRTVDDEYRGEKQECERLVRRIGRDELRQQRKKKQRDLRIQHICQKTLPIDPTEWFGAEHRMRARDGFISAPEGGGA